jgi:hypothetical protein
MSEQPPTPPESSPAVPPAATPPADPPQVFDAQMFPPRRRPWVQFLLDHNPALLLSTVLMLLGCYLLNGTIDGSAGAAASDRLQLLSLLGVINLYEACIIPLGLVLIRRRRGAGRDGLWLLLFETLFLVNGTFLNVEPSARWGWTLNGVLFALACVKAAVILRGLKIPLVPRTLGFLVLQLAIIYGMPILLFNTSVDGRVPQRVTYGLYWLVGLLPVAYDLLARTGEPLRLGLVQQVIRRTYLIAPWLMLVAHLGFSHWAHRSPFTPADLTPLFLGLTIAATRGRLPHDALGLTRLLPAAAWIVSFSAPQTLEWDLPGGPTLHPAMVAAGAMFVTYGYLFSLTTAAVTLAAVSLAGAAYALQDRLVAIAGRVLRFMADLLRGMAALAPSSAAGWGVCAVVAAFVLLAVGAVTSLKRKEG